MNFVKLIWYFHRERSNREYRDNFLRHFSSHISLCHTNIYYYKSFYFNFRPPREPELSSQERELARRLIGRFRRSKNITTSTVLSFFRPLNSTEPPILISASWNNILLLFFIIFVIFILTFVCILINIVNINKYFYMPR